MILGGILTAIAIMIIFAKIHPTITKLIVGYDWVIDLIISIGIAILFATTGTISGVMIGIIAGLTISITLFLAKKFFGYAKIKFVASRLRVVYYPQTWNLKTLMDFWI